MSEKDKARKDVEEVADRIEANNERLREIQRSQHQPVVYTGTYQPTPMTKEEKVALGVLGVIAAGVLGALTWFGIKDEEKRLAELKEHEEKREAERKEQEERIRIEAEALERWKDDARSAGKIVCRLRDGSYIAIPAEAYRDADIRKP